MPFPRLLRVCALATISLLALPGCPKPEPPKPPPTKPVTEEDAHEALVRAKKKKDADMLLDVFNKYPKMKSGKEALKLGARMLAENAVAAAEECDEPAAKGALAKIAPYTSDDPEIDSLYDETTVSVKREKSRCILLKVDADVKKAEGEWDWPRAFNRIVTEKEAEGASLKKRREELTVRWKAWIDGTLTKIVEKKSLSVVVGDKKEKFLESVAVGNLPDELSGEVTKRADAVLGVTLVFDKLDGGQVLDPPVKYWTYGAAKARRPDAPNAADGIVMANGVPFLAVAKGKAGGVSLLVAGKEGSNAVERLSGVKLLIPEAEARPFDTNAVLPEKLVGVRVLAPVAAGSDVLTPSIVLSDNKGAVVVEPLKKGGKVNTKRKEMRGLLIPQGTPVEVLVSGKWKKGEIADALEEERVLVKVGGFESYFPLADVRVKRGDLPKLPE